MFAIKRREEEDPRWVRDPDRGANDPRRYGTRDDKKTFTTREEATMAAFGFEEVVAE